ncbi:7978_t:CDS:2 [Ambispora gerdemannii]|uniref:Asparagine--tRNA ligase, mitochondrial n=1 Tax=Ambispora gerdemannii TaxID=144530 RepID=A0A9N9FMU5_9GLOM|nr:7978_t:CDS:2 [Ambispora gerdemannii]
MVKSCFKNPFAKAISQSYRSLLTKSIKRIVNTTSTGVDVEIHGWVKSVRMQKNDSFAEINDGSSSRGIQAILTKEQAKEYDFTDQQNRELQADQVEILGKCDAATYPLQKKHHSFDFLREISHLRPRSNTFSALARVRNGAITGFETFFQQNEFLHVHTPILTASDCEGGSKVFKISTDCSTSQQQEYFDRPVYLTVSGQLHAEIMASSLSRVYTFGPVFRAEESVTSKHLAEFWMHEAEIAFITKLDDLLEFTEECIRATTTHVLENLSTDIDFFKKWIDKSLETRLESLNKAQFIRMPYAEAIDVLSNSKQEFDFTPKYGTTLKSEHEKFLANEHCRAPVFITDYPKSIKPFYMRVNNDGETVACFDLLVPKIGELVGGSLREERYEQLESQMIENGLCLEEYQWYLDLRKYGSVPHGGFGIGFDRYLQFVTGIDNIRDVVAFPRAVGQCRF